ncbi:MAG: hypothetical protein HY064_04615 [Bacteroidetes bacterium]|nr:hypothetical protein [Bacteroidota bacterium]
MAISKTAIDSDISYRILSISQNWKRCPMVFWGDTLCAFSIANMAGTSRAMIHLLVVDKNSGLRILLNDTGNYRAVLQGQVYFIPVNAKQGLCYIHNSPCDSAEVYYRAVFKYRVTTKGFVQVGNPWNMYLPDQYDTLLYPNNSSVEGYRKYFTKVFSKHK